MPPSRVPLPAAAARRFVLGRQGLWPGRRWQGESGTRTAMRAVEHLQLDPLNITARSQDLMLHARVANYEPEGWQRHAYEERGFFEWGGWLALRPMEELPHFRHFMRREAEHPKMVEWMSAHKQLLDEMRELLKEEGPLTNRDFSAAARKRVNHYRGRKDSAVALYNLWRTGEVMIEDRVRFERSYDLTQRIAPHELIREAPAAEAERLMMLKSVAFYGLRGDHGNYPLPGFPRVPAARAALRELEGEGLIMRVDVDGQPRPHYVTAGDLPLLEQVALGEVPREWRPVGASTREQVTFLAPLDPVVARGRAAKLFGFDYVWEVYKPESKRIWGYYVLPILWDDQLVARADMRFDREAGTLRLLGFWLEEPGTAERPEFAGALKAGLKALQCFIGAETLDSSGIEHAALRRAVTPTS